MFHNSYANTHQFECKDDRGEQPVIKKLSVHRFVIDDFTSVSSHVIQNFYFLVPTN